MNDSGDDEQPLKGGRTTQGVVKIRDTVRRPRSVHSDFVTRLLKHLEARGFEGAPRYLGRDDCDRDVFSYIPGEVPPDLGLFTRAQLTQGARLLRSLHDATADFEAKGAAEVVCHGDASPCNCVFADGVPRAFIDFDDAHPGSRLEDVGYAAWLWLDIGNEEIAGDVQRDRLQRFIGDYGLTNSCSPSQLVQAAQSRHMANSALADHVRQWSEECLQWVIRQGWN